jgi:preprotein translocase subunit SecF
MQFFAETNIDFITKRKIGYVISGIVILAGIISLIVHGGPQWNIDFQGGTLIHLKFEKNVKIEEVRDALAKRGFGESEIKHFGTENEVVIRTGISEDPAEFSNLIEPMLKQAFPDNPFQEQRVETVGPKIGKELVIDALDAVLWALVLILLYVMWRFRLNFALGAILALAHDVLVTIGVFSLLDIEISAPVIAAVLTIVGYSLNDTIVIFDRIRENLKVRQRDAGAFVTIINRSINETLSRTIITSMTTLFVVIVLFFFGGEVLRSFAFALIIGIVSGTYSTIFIATPFVVEWHLKKATAK